MSSIVLCSSNGGNSSPAAAAASNCSEAASARRRTLSVVVACMLQEAGCMSVEKAVVGTLVEMLQSTIVELGRTSRGYCELAYRSEPLVADIVLALADMGINHDGLQPYCFRANRNMVPAPQLQMDNKQHTILQVGDKKSHPNHIPEHLPSFPDTHTYCFTPTVKQPVTEYEAIREKAATQKRDIERALTKFGTKTNPTESVFFAEDKEFALMMVAPSVSQNIDALMPRDQVFEAELDYEVTKARKKRQDRLSNLQHQQQMKGEHGEPEQDAKVVEVIESDVMDNPYLRAVKMPRKSSRSATKQQPVAHSRTNGDHKQSTLGPNINRIVLAPPPAGGEGGSNNNSNDDAASVNRDDNKTREIRGGATYDATDPTISLRNDESSNYNGDDLVMRKDEGTSGCNDAHKPPSHDSFRFNNSPSQSDRNLDNFYENEREPSNLVSDNYHSGDPDYPLGMNNTNGNTAMSDSRRDVGAATRGLEEAARNFPTDDNNDDDDDEELLLHDGTMMEEQQAGGAMVQNFANTSHYNDDDEDDVMNQQQQQHDNMMLLESGNGGGGSMMQHDQDDDADLMQQSNEEIGYNETVSDEVESSVAPVDGQFSYVTDDGSRIMSHEAPHQMHPFN